MNGIIEKLKNKLTNMVVFPVTVSKAVYMEDGQTNLDQKLTAQDNKIGILNGLTTTDKTSVVGAVNEVKSTLSSQLADIVYSMSDFPKINGESDDTGRLQRANDKTTLDNAILNLGRTNYEISQKITFTCNLNGLNATVTANNIVGTAVFVGFNVSASRLTGKQIYLPQVINKVMSWDGTQDGVEIGNTYQCYITIPYVYNFNAGLKLTSYSTGNVYNEYHIGHLCNNKINILIQTVGTGWVNDNHIFINRLSHLSSSGANVSGCRQIKLYSDINSINNNTFYKATFEGDVKEYDIELVNASYNQFIGSRWESTTPKVLCNQIDAAKTSVWNMFFLGYKSENVVVTENGLCMGNSIMANRSLMQILGTIKMLNTTSNGNPCFEIYDPIDKLSNASASDYLVSMSGLTYKAKRKTDVYPRVIVDHSSGKFKFGNGTADPVFEIGSYGASSGKVSGGNLYFDGTWNGSKIILGTYQLWVDSTGKLRMKNGTPANETDGTIVGTQS